MSGLPPPPLPPPMATNNGTNNINIPNFQPLPPPPIPLGIPPPSVPPQQHPHSIVHQQHQHQQHQQQHGVVHPQHLQLQMQMHQQQHQHQQQQILIPKHNPTTLILTHVPSFLRYPRNLRDWIYTCCGSVKSVAYSCEIRRSYVTGNTYGSSSNAGGSNGDSKNKTKDSKGSGSGSTINTKDSVVAIVRMSHSSGAFNLVRNWEPACRRLSQPPKEAAPEPTPTSTSEPPAITNEESTTPKPKPTTPIEMRAFLLYATNEHSAPFDPLSNPHDALSIDSVWDGLHGVRPSSEAADESVVTKLVDAFRTVRSRQESTDALPSAAATPSTAGAGAADPALPIAPAAEGAPANDRRLDVSKVAAAAGGGAYDEEADPLNAPAVLEAVAAFKTKLEESGSRIRTKRAEYVGRRLVEETAKARVRLVERRRAEEEERRDRLENGGGGGGGGVPPPPPLPVGAVPNVPAVGTALDTGKRGVSNLPSWMTSAAGVKRSADEITSADGRPQPPPPPLPPSSDPAPPPPPPAFLSEANRDPNTRKIPRLLDTGSSSVAQIRAANQAADAAAAAVRMKSWTAEQILAPGATFPPSIDPTRLATTIREFVEGQIIEYLGEVEGTFVDFVMNHLGKSGVGGGEGCTTKALLDELSIVLDEDAETFVVDLFQKILED